MAGADAASRNGLDDQLTASFVGHRDLGAVKSYIDEITHFRFVEHVVIRLARVIETDVSDHVALARRALRGIGQAHFAKNRSERDSSPYLVGLS
jgi:hypothetical protein